MLNRDSSLLSRSENFPDYLSDRYSELQGKLKGSVGSLVLLVREESFKNRAIDYWGVGFEQSMGILVSEPDLDFPANRVILPMNNHVTRDFDSSYDWTSKIGSASFPWRDLSYLGSNAEGGKEEPMIKSGLQIYSGTQEIERYFIEAADLINAYPRAMELLRVEPSERFRRFQEVLKSSASS